ncbi:hypothetical protein ACXYMT_15075 [Salinimicrobium sp. CAU 1759]
MTKKLFFYLTVTMIIFSCSKSDDNQNVINPDFLGKWKLTETLQDPGDGSGVYERIDSEKTIEFFNNGTFSINGPLCGLSTSVGENIMGQVRNSNYSNNNILLSNEKCSTDNSSTEYIVVIENSDLIIYYTACVEGCAQKYQKVTAE